jgi:hypothetical protein
MLDPSKQTNSSDTQPSNFDSIPEERKLRQTSITSFLVPTTSLQRQDSVKLPTNPDCENTKPWRACTNPKCKYCPYLNRDVQISCHLNGKTYFTKQNVTCQSSNLIYGIECKRCGKHYVGQTKCPLYQRLSEHQWSINICSTDKPIRPQPVGIHFSAPDHIRVRDLEIQILDFVHFHPDSKKAEEIRLRVEKKWILRFRCPAPSGMNIFY